MSDLSISPRALASLSAVSYTHLATTSRFKSFDPVTSVPPSEERQDVGTVWLLGLRCWSGFLCRTCLLYTSIECIKPEGVNLTLFAPVRLYAGHDYKLIAETQAKEDVYKRQVINVAKVWRPTCAERGIEMPARSCRALSWAR